ncbi:hypothetical protein BH24DEI2_BH24DEI2_08650 [soil metagenome]
MSTTDKRGKLDAEPFSYRTSKDGKVFLSFESKQVKILKGNEAERFSTAVSGASVSDAQLLMAKLTGNFKRGNERRPVLKNFVLKNPTLKAKDTL